MQYNGRLLASARERLGAIREENSRERERRTQRAYSRVPGLRETDAQLREQMLTLARLTLSKEPDAPEKLRRLERDNLALQESRSELLAGYGYPADYTDEIYSCPVCHDTGMDGVNICSCLLRLYNEEVTRELSPLLRNGDESFEKFSLLWYSEGEDRERMSLVLNLCREYAKNFPTAPANLVFQGGTGLGKTYLSACVARAVAEKGFSVAYETTSAALAQFETQKFSRGDDEGEKAGARVRQYLGCDLMILDDLGTEMTTAFSISALYQLINTRLIDRKATIISTNLSSPELERRYGEQICSRLFGEFEFLPFRGRDIRLQRRERS